jgi:AcrR family transcriptional regulator
VRQRLLAAAVELIPDLGWAAVSTRILAERAGVTPSVVHYHFPSLQAVLQEAALGAMQQVVAGLDGLLDNIETPGGLVDAVLASAQHYTGTDPMSLLLVEAYLAARRDERFRREIGQLLADCRARFTQRLAEHGVPDSDATSAVVFAALDGLVLHRGLGIISNGKCAAASLRRLVGHQQEGRVR